MFVRVESYHGMHAVPHGHPEPIGGCHEHIGKICARARMPYWPRNCPPPPTPPALEAAPEKEEEAAEARHLLCVCVCCFASMIAWWTITNCVDVFLVRARKKKVCVWRNCDVK